MQDLRKRSLLTLDSAFDHPEILHECKKREWFFAFCSNEQTIPWYQRLVIRNHPKHLHHTYAFADCGGLVLFVEPSVTKVDFTLKATDPLTAAAELSAAGHTVVRHKFAPNLATRAKITNIIPSCVSVVKVATGYSSYAVTPKGLMECLINKGAEVI